MYIKDLIDLQGGDALMDAGDLDGQIAQDFEDFIRRLQDDKKPEHWKKIKYAQRIVQLARQASNAGRLEYGKSEFLAMPRAGQLMAAQNAAARLAAQVGPYDPVSVYAERQSVHPEDWYLWTAAAYREDTKAWSVWTMNLSTGGLSGGVYDIKDMKSCNEAIARKKHALKESQVPGQSCLEKAEQVLADNGIDPDEAQTVLQALGYVLLDQEWYPEASEPRE